MYECMHACVCICVHAGMGECVFMYTAMCALICVDVELMCGFLLASTKSCCGRDRSTLFWSTPEIMASVVSGTFEVCHGRQTTGLYFKSISELQ